MEAFVLFLIVTAVIIWLVVRGVKSAKIRKNYLDEFEFPQAVQEAVRTTYPHISEADSERAVEGLRDFLSLSWPGALPRKALPSRVVEVAWRALMNEESTYAQLCQTVYKKPLKFTPSEPMMSPTDAQVELMVIWTSACDLENVDAKNPEMLPRLFALDRELTIPDGYCYILGDEDQTAFDNCFDARRIGRYVETFVE